MTGWPLLLLAAAVVTPPDARVAVVRVLNKDSGRVQDVSGTPGTTARVEALTIAIRGCETTPPWEKRQTGVFVQVDEKPRQGDAKRIFSGWLFAESPSLNSVASRRYDVWAISCAMSFPQTGPDTVVAGAPGAKRSPARGSAAASDTPAPAAPASSAENAPATESAAPN